MTTGYARKRVEEYFVIAERILQQSLGASVREVTNE